VAQKGRNPGRAGAEEPDGVLGRNLGQDQVAGSCWWWWPEKSASYDHPKYRTATGCDRTHRALRNQVNKMIITPRLLAIIGLTANVIGASLMAKYETFARIKLIEKTPNDLKIEKRANIGWFLFIAGFVVQIIALAIDT
jgi:hypothetical protein